MSVMYYTYMLRCKDNTIYTGITTDIERRMLEHFERGEKCAKYTIRHIPEKLECVWTSDSRKLASKLEYHIKTLTKAQKEKLICKEAKLEDFLSEKLECYKYSLDILSLKKISKE